ncbi:methyl-accepting chemotaxis protein [Maridesulfovibrio sp.]|uniref:methyl-accepting chemotaxis protein n=1 Tax=Maridesulfovibrio sp. TaxID=2795000 RepID=UPI002A189EF2|nr:methyl-accepting chemotaxis protein [Maridesulfovibrio sp.]
MRIKSVNGRLALIIAAVVTVSVALFVVVVSEMTSSAVLSIQEQNMGVLKNKVVSEVEEFLEMSRNDLHGLIKDKVFLSGFSEQGDEISTALQIELESRPNLIALAAFNGEGKVVYGRSRDGRDTTGLDLRSRDYVRKILNGSDFVVSDVVRSKDDGKLIVVMAIPVRDAAGRLLGGMFTAVDWQEYSHNIIGNIKVGDNGYAYILDGKGVVIACEAEKDAVLKNLSDMQFVKDSLAADEGRTSYVWNGDSILQSFQVVPSTRWVVCMTAYESDITSAAIKERNVLIGLGLLMILVLVGIIVFTLRRQVTGPMAAIKDFTSEIAGGNFKAELNGKFICELKDLADNVEHMVGEIKQKLGFSEGVLKGLVLPCAIVGPDNRMLWANSQICEFVESKVNPDQVIGLTSGEFFYHEPDRDTLSRRAIREEKQLQMEVEYTTASGKHKNVMVSCTPFYDMDGAMLGSVALWVDMTEIREQQRKIEENSIMISEAAASATEISDQVTSFSEALAAQVEQSSRGAEEQSMMVSEAATAMDEMNSTVFEVARNASAAADLAHGSQLKAGEGENIVAQAVASISQVQSQSEQMRNDMAELGKQAEGIGNIMEVISDIADQTNLLALNAAIEAARAGEAGRGFAVVADEVRKLAEKTMTATSEVGQYISSIQSSTRTNIDNTEITTKTIGEVTDMINRSGEVLKEIVTSISETSDQVRSIATASEQQSAASEQISRSTGQIQAIAGETSQAMNESAEAVSRMSELAHELNEIIARMQA